VARLCLGAGQEVFVYDNFCVSVYKREQFVFRNEVILKIGCKVCLGQSRLTMHEFCLSFLSLSCLSGLCLSFWHMSGLC